jgi:hypothetical protein
VVEDEDLEEGYTRESEDIPGVIKEEKEAGTHMGKDSLHKGKMTGRFPYYKHCLPEIGEQGRFDCNQHASIFPFVSLYSFSIVAVMEMYILKLYILVDFLVVVLDYRTWRSVMSDGSEQMTWTAPFDGYTTIHVSQSSCHVSCQQSGQLRA